MYRVGVTGGIGGGKSTLCRYFAQMGVPIYNTDQRAKELMVSSEKLRAEICGLFGEQAYIDEQLNRDYLSEKIFGDPSLRDSLSGVVHPAVRDDFDLWAQSHGADVEYVIVESAILFGSGFERYIDASIAVLAPEQLRVERAMSRDSLSEEQVRARIASQLSDEQLHELADYTVVNIFEQDLEVAAKRLDKIFRAAAKKRK